MNPITDTSHKPLILIVDDDEGILDRLADIVRDEDWFPKTFTAGRSALNYFLDNQVDQVILDLSLPDMHGLEILKVMKDNKPQVPVLVLTGQGYNVDNAIDATLLGAANFLEKPVSSVQLVQSIRGALEVSRLQVTNEHLRQLNLAGRGIFGHSRSMRQVLYLMERYTDVDHPILITGETGTGKSVLAETLHSMSRFHDHPFYTIDCSHLTDELFVSEMFGHKKGSYTGAHSDKKGKVEMAAGGTLFLDEIQELSLVNQGRLRRFIETRFYTPLGEVKETQVHTHIIVAANRKLEDLVQRGDFLNDLLLRFKAFTINLPNLEERLEDIPELANHFFRREMQVSDKLFQGFTPKALFYLQSLHYPGNMRSLQGLVQRAIALADYSLDKQFIDERDLHLAWSLEDPERQTGPDDDDNGPIVGSFKERVEAFKHKILVEALRHHKGNMTAAAHDLGLALDNLSHKVRKFGIDVKGMKKG